MVTKGVSGLMKTFQDVTASVIILTSFTSLLFCAYVFIESRCALARESTTEQDLEIKIMEDYLQQLNARIWQLERRLLEKPDDIDLREEITKLREEYLQQLRFSIQQLEKRLEETPDDTNIKKELEKLRREKEGLEFRIKEETIRQEKNE